MIFFVFMSAYATCCSRELRCDDTLTWSDGSDAKNPVVRSIRGQNSGRLTCRYTSRTAVMRRFSDKFSTNMRAVATHWPREWQFHRRVVWCDGSGVKNPVGRLTHGR